MDESSTGAGEFPDRPRLAAHVVVREVDGHAFAMNLRSSVVVQLNSDALAVWRLCDGIHSIAQMEHSLASGRKTDPTALGTSLREALRSAMALGFLERENDTSAHAILGAMHPRDSRERSRPGEAPWTVH